MELAGEVAINASRERVWSALNDAQVLQACVPGCEEVIEESAEIRNGDASSQRRIGNEETETIGP